MLRYKLTSLMIAAALGLAGLGAARAQEPMPVAPADVIVPIGCKDACPAPACPETACPETCKKCVPTTRKKIIEHRCYSSKCEDFCAPKCGHMLGGLFSHKSCGSCNKCDTGCNKGCEKGCNTGCATDCEACHKCGKVRTRKALYVTIKKEEQCLPDCLVVEEAAPACAVKCAPACQAPCVAPQMPKSEGLPNPPKVVDPKK